jgi:VWFA-related protein
VRCSLSGFIFLIACFVSPAYPQAAIVSSESHLLAPVTTISKAVDEVNLAFTVTDKKGHFINNLQPDDFALRDNNLAPTRLTFFQQRSDLPLHLAVLIDTSASVKNRLKFEQQAALTFLKKILRSETDEAFVVAFNDQVSTIQEPTDKIAEISKALKSVTADGDTSLYSAVIYASEKLRQLPEHQMTRKGIVLISDGVDTVNQSTLQQAKEAAVRADAMVFALSTNFSEIEPNAEGDGVLKELAAYTGGALLPGHNDSQLDSAFRKIEKALRNQYVIAYHPAEFQADGSYRTIEVVPHKTGLRANCRRGYYAVVRALL